MASGGVDDEGGDAHRVENVQPGQTNRGEHSGKSDGVADVMILLELADVGDGDGDSKPRNATNYFLIMMLQPICNACDNQLVQS